MAHVRNSFLLHLESLYSVAQLLTPDSERASRLVEATYQRAYGIPKDLRPAPEHEKPWLLHLMMQVREEIGHPSPESPEVTITPEYPEEELHPDTFRRRLADQLVDRLLPLALAGISDEDRLLLVLCEVEGLTCEDAGEVLGIEPGQACERVVASRAQLIQEVSAIGTPAERHLLKSGLESEWLKDGLLRLTQVERSPLPPSLRANISAVARQATLEQPDKMRATAGGRSGFLGGRFAAIDWSRRFATPLLLIFGAGILGITLSSLLKEEPESNLILLSADKAEDVRVLYRTRNADEAESFVLERMKWRLRIPAIEQAVFQGVSIQEVTPGIVVPVLVYDDQVIDQPIYVYAYNYVLLDRSEARLTLDADVLDQIREDGHFDMYEMGEDKVLIWRSRDEIFVGITHGDAEALKERIRVEP